MLTTTGRPHRPVRVLLVMAIVALAVVGGLVILGHALMPTSSCATPPTQQERLGRVVTVNGATPYLSTLRRDDTLVRYLGFSDTVLDRGAQLRRIWSTARLSP